MNQSSERPSVLIVDDTPENIDILSAILRKDYRILVANNGERAQDVCHRHLPSLVLLDVMMPGMDGYEVCRRLKQDPVTADIPVIFITAANRVEDEVEGLAAGAVDFLTKPVNPPVVAARVRTHVELKAQRDWLRKLSQVDGLTGAGNRRSLEETLGREWRRCARAGDSLALLLVDIDDFDSFNDLYGHQAGDRCLRRLAATLIAGLGRPGDLVARLQGDRFACVLPGTGLDGLQRIVERLGQDVGNLFIPHARADGNGYVSVSMAGLATIPDFQSATMDLLPRTEELLVRAKRGGSARALIASPDATAVPIIVSFGSSRGFDPEVGLRRTGGVEERYRNFVARFLTEHAGDARLVEERLAAKDRQGAHRVSHTLESIAGSLGANALADAAARVSAVVADGKDVGDELARFRRELMATIRQMRGMLGAMPEPAADSVAVPVSAQQTTHVLGQLATLTAQFDSEATWFFEQHRSAIEQVMAPERFRALSDSLSHFDYDMALRALQGANSGDGQ